MVNCSGTSNSYMIPHHRCCRRACYRPIPWKGKRSTIGPFRRHTSPTWENLFNRRWDVGFRLFENLVLTACVVWCHWLWQLPKAVYLDMKNALLALFYVSPYFLPIQWFCFWLPFISNPLFLHPPPLLFLTPVIEPSRSQASLDVVTTVSMIHTRRADSIYCVIAMIAQLVLSVSMYSVPWKIRPVCSAFFCDRACESARYLFLVAKRRDVNHIVWVKYLDDSAGT